mmetsp:Transcript_26041/g.67298  ORF Transcript_26041/g.67298 Transcript_26041/m.67298 type:complete len:376 (+) Transcript_26041:144-1271(+)
MVLHIVGSRRRHALLAGLVCAWIAHHLGVPELLPRAATVVRTARTRWWRRRKGSGASPDPSEAVPINFQLAEKTPARARQRWQATLRWRAAEGVDRILTEPHKYFYAVKAHYPHTLHLPDKEGRLTYWEQVGRLDMDALKRCGVSPYNGYRHYVWHTEYTWNIAAPKEGAQATVIFDCAGFSWDYLSLELLDLIKRIVSFTNAHYPHRAARIIVVNTPVWYNTMYTILKPIMSDICEAKLVFFTEKDVRAGKMLKYIAAANLPVEYGGRSKVALGESKVERSMRTYVDKVNRRAGVRAISPCVSTKELRARRISDEREERQRDAPPFWAKWFNSGGSGAGSTGARGAASNVDAAPTPPDAEGSGRGGRKGAPSRR